MKEFRMFFRTLLIQSLVNYRWMQGNAYLYALSRNTGSKGREIPFFNAHPWLAPAIIGLVENLKEKAEYNEEQESRMRLRWMGALGAVGDGVIWSTLRPLFVLGGLFVLAMEPEFFWVVPVVFLFVSFLIRWLAFKRGLQGESHLVAALEKINPPRILYFGRSILPTLGLAVAGFLVTGLLYQHLALLDPKEQMVAVLLVVCGGAGVASLRSKTGAKLIFYGTAAAAVLWECSHLWL